MAEDAGALLVRSGLIEEGQLLQARQAQASLGGTVGEHLVLAGAIADDRLAEFYRARLMVPQVTLRQLARIKKDMINKLPAEMAIEFRCVPVSLDRDRNLTVAMADPSITHIVDEIAFFTGSYVVRAVATQSQIAWAIAHYYGRLTALGDQLLRDPAGALIPGPMPPPASLLRVQPPAPREPPAPHTPPSDSAPHPVERSITGRVAAERHHALTPQRSPFHDSAPTPIAYEPTAQIHRTRPGTDRAMSPQALATVAPPTPSERVRPQTARPQTARPQTARPQTARPQTARPETAQPDVASPDAKLALKPPTEEERRTISSPIPMLIEEPETLAPRPPPRRARSEGPQRVISFFQEDTPTTGPLPVIKQKESPPELVPRAGIVHVPSGPIRKLTPESLPAVLIAIQEANDTQAPNTDHKPLPLPVPAPERGEDDGDQPPVPDADADVTDADVTDADVTDADVTDAGADDDVTDADADDDVTDQEFSAIDIQQLAVTLDPAEKPQATLVADDELPLDNDEASPIEPAARPSTITGGHDVVARKTKRPASTKNRRRRQTLLGVGLLSSSHKIFNRGPQEVHSRFDQTLRHSIEDVAQIVGDTPAPSSPVPAAPSSPSPSAPYPEPVSVPGDTPVEPLVSHLPSPSASHQDVPPAEPLTRQPNEPLNDMSDGTPVLAPEMRTMRAVAPRFDPPPMPEESTWGSTISAVDSIQKAAIAAAEAHALTHGTRSREDRSGATEAPSIEDTIDDLIDTQELLADEPVPPSSTTVRDAKPGTISAQTTSPLDRLQVEGVDDEWGPPGTTIPPPFLGAVSSDGTTGEHGIPLITDDLEEPVSDLRMIPLPTPDSPLVDADVPRTVMRTDSGRLGESVQAPLSLYDSEHVTPGVLREFEASQEALAELLRQLQLAETRDAVIGVLVAHLAKTHEHVAFFAVKSGRLEPWQVHVGREARPAARVDGVWLRLDFPSTFQDIVGTRLPFRGPIDDAASREFIRKLFGSSSAEMLGLPVTIRERVVGILYGDSSEKHVFVQNLSVLTRAAGGALERILKNQKN